jgi:hypothetical protein
MVRGMNCYYSNVIEGHDTHPADAASLCCIAGAGSFRQGQGNRFPGSGKQRWSEGRTAELERKVGREILEIDFLKGCVQRR